MKTATLPPLRVDPKLRSEAERLLRKGETLSSFLEEAVRQAVERRASQAAFIKRGVASAAKARKTGDYVSAKDVLTKLEARLQEARSSNRGQKRTR